MTSFERAESPRDLVELRKNVSEKQSEMFKSSLVKLMERSNDNSELTNVLRDFIKEIEIKSWKGDSNGPMTEGHIAGLVEFFREKIEELKRL